MAPATPKWISNPNGLRHLFANAVILILLPVSFCMPPIFLVMSLGLEQPMATDLIWLSAGPPIIGLGLCWWLALGLALLPRPEDTSGAFA